MCDRSMPDPMIESSFTIYTQAGKTCPWCEKAAEVLDTYGLAYMIRPLSKSKLLEVARRANMTTVPIIYHGVKKIGGFEELVQFLDENNN